MILDTTASYLALFQETPSNNEDLEEQHESLRKALKGLDMPSLWNALVGYITWFCECYICTIYSTQKRSDRSLGPTFGTSCTSIGKMVVENPWDGCPLIINPIYTLYHVGIDVFIGSQSPFHWFNWFLQFFHLTKKQGVQGMGIFPVSHHHHKCPDSDRAFLGLLGCPAGISNWIITPICRLDTSP